MFLIVSEMEGKIKHPTFKVGSKCSQMSPSVVGDFIMVSRNIMTDQKYYEPSKQDGSFLKPI